MVRERTRAAGPASAAGRAAWRGHGPRPRRRPQRLRSDRAERPPCRGVSSRVLPRTAASPRSTRHTCATKVGRWLAGVGRAHRRLRWRRLCGKGTLPGCGHRSGTWPEQSHALPEAARGHVGRVVADADVFDHRGTQWRTARRQRPRAPPRGRACRWRSTEDVGVASGSDRGKLRAIPRFPRLKISRGRGSGSLRQWQRRRQQAWRCPKAAWQPRLVEPRAPGAQMGPT